MYSSKSIIDPYVKISSFAPAHTSSFKDKLLVLQDLRFNTAMKNYLLLLVQSSHFTGLTYFKNFTHCTHWQMLTHLSILSSKVITVCFTLFVKLHTYYALPVLRFLKIQDQQRFSFNHNYYCYEAIQGLLIYSHLLYLAKNKKRL